MTLREAIERADDLFPNSYSQDLKIEWLEALDSMIYRDIISTHVGSCCDWCDEFEGYTEANLDDELVVGQPYQEIYYFWLESKICYQNAEYAKYNNAVLRFNDYYEGYKNDYNRHHRPKTRKVKFY